MESVKIGIELEFMVAHLKLGKAKKVTKWVDDSRWPEGLDRHHTTDQFFANTACIKKVCDVLANRGLPVACPCAPPLLDGDPLLDGALEHLYVKLEGKHHVRVWNQDRAANSGRRRFNYWFVTHEPYITHDLHEKPLKGTPSGYEWFALEINSPIMTSRNEFDEKLPTIRKALADLQSRVKIWTNKECGFHVHVSPPKQDVDLLTAKKAVALSFLIEDRVLLGFCHPIRRKSNYAQMASTGSQIAKGGWGYSVQTEEDDIIIGRLRNYRRTLPENGDLNMKTFQILNTIFTQVRMDTLRKGLNLPKKNAQVTAEDGGRSGLSISNFGTVEFRYPEASFDADFISFWVDLVRRIFTIAMMGPPHYCQRLCVLFKMATSPQSFAWEAWLRALELTNWEPFCRRRFEQYKGPLADLNKGGILPNIGVAKEPWSPSNEGK